MEWVDFFLIYNQNPKLSFSSDFFFYVVCLYLMNNVINSYICINTVKTTAEELHAKTHFDQGLNLIIYVLTPQI